MQGHLVFLKLSHFLLIICPTVQICILCISTPMIYYTSCFQKKPCSCCQRSGPLYGSGILRQWLGKSLYSPRQALLGARAEGTAGDKARHASPLPNVYGKGGISLIVQPAAPEFLLGLLEGTGAVPGHSGVFPSAVCRLLWKAPKGRIASSPFALALLALAPTQGLYLMWKLLFYTAACHINGGLGLEWIKYDFTPAPVYCVYR